METIVASTAWLIFISILTILYQLEKEDNNNNNNKILESNQQVNKQKLTSDHQ